MHLSACPGYHFYVQPEWNLLSRIIPKDSIFEALLYIDRSGSTQIRFFDMLLFFGIAQMDFDILQRQGKFYTFLRDYHWDFLHTYHWVGYAKICYKCLQDNLACNTLSFDSHHMVVVSPTSRLLQEIICPLQIPQGTCVPQSKVK